MQITDDTFNGLAKLAHLHFTKEERETMKGDLSQILTWVEQLQQVDVTMVEPQRHMCHTNNLLRADAPLPGLLSNEALKSAAQSEHPFFSVPKFINR